VVDAVGGLELLSNPLRPGDAAQTWDFGQPATIARAVTVNATQRGGGVCERGIAATGSVVCERAA